MHLFSWGVIMVLHQNQFPDFGNTLQTPGPRQDQDKETLRMSWVWYHFKSGLETKTAPEYDNTINKHNRNKQAEILPEFRWNFTSPCLSSGHRYVSQIQMNGPSSKSSYDKQGGTKPNPTFWSSGFIRKPTKKRAAAGKKQKQKQIAVGIII